MTLYCLLRNIATRYAEVKKNNKMIKEKLKNINPSIVEQLPHGAINILAKEFSYARQSIVLMLKGERGREENVKKVLIAALNIIADEAQDKTKIVKEIKQLISK